MTAQATHSRLFPGGGWLFDGPASVEPLWGAGDDVLAAAGEALLICGPPGTGKTTIVQQLCLRRIGLIEEPLLGMAVVADARPVLYIAADRPKQARRSARRMVAEKDREALDARLLVWQGPLEFDAAKDNAGLARLTASCGAGMVVIDSLKDVVGSLVSDEAGVKIAQGWQRCVAEGVEVVVIHHQRKASAENRKPSALADVYGSAFLTAAAGSVVVLWGSAGDPVVELLHLKQPAAEVGPLTVEIDHKSGTLALVEGTDLLAILRASHGLTAHDAARRLFGTETPSKAEEAKARRRLDRWVEQGLAMVRGGEPMKGAVRTPRVYYALDSTSTPRAHGLFDGTPARHGNNGNGEG